MEKGQRRQQILSHARGWDDDHEAIVGGLFAFLKRGVLTER